jgi:hypothetical protein
MISASANCRTKDIRVCAIVVPELKLGNVQRKIFVTDFVKRVNHSALEDGPETLNSVSKYGDMSKCEVSKYG